MKFANEEERVAMIVAANSIIFNLLLSVGKLAAGFFAQSAAMMADGVHSASDVLSTFVVMAGIKMSNKAADEDHAYGHERFECVAAIVLAVFLSAVGLGIGYSGYEKLTGADASELAIPGQMALWAAIVSIVVKEGMYWYTVAAAKKINSDALRADAWHHRTDAISSVGAFVGILGAQFGYPLLDPAVSILICFMILYAAYDIFAEALSKMTDQSCDEDTEKALKATIEKVDGVDHLDTLNTRLFGNRVYVDVEISVEDRLSVVEAHAIAEAVHSKIEEEFPIVKHCMVHVNPKSEHVHECPNKI